MKRYVEYNDNGNILRFGVCSTKTFNKKQMEGEHILEYFGEMSKKIDLLQKVFEGKIIDKTPSANLWKGQTDEDELGMTYEQLDKVLKGEVLEGKNYDRVQELRRKSEHKKQMPPTIKLR